jgi:hypothetical protein
LQDAGTKQAASKGKPKMKRIDCAGQGPVFQMGCMNTIKYDGMEFRKMNYLNSFHNCIFFTLFIEESSFCIGGIWPHSITFSAVPTSSPVDSSNFSIAFAMEVWNQTENLRFNTNSVSIYKLTIIC